MDLSKLSISELRDLQQQIPLELKRRESEEKVKVMNELRAIAKARGFSIDELLGKESRPKNAGGKVRVKYRHPQDASLEWTGRGRKPKWVESWVAAGGALDSLLV